MDNKKIKIAILVFSLLAAMFSYYVWQVFKTPNFDVKAEKPFVLLIPKGANFQTVLDTLNKHQLVRDQLSFRFLAKLMSYPEKVKAGRYLIYSESGNFEILRKLRNGRQDAIRLVINTFRLKEDIAGKLSKQLPFDSTFILKQLDSNAYLSQYGFNKETVPCLFIPNTYEILWTSSFDSFMLKMNKEYKKFWNTDRQTQAEKLALSPTEVGILASIVEGESKKSDEQARIAGVYWNRLKTGMPLQADPTIVFAWKDFTIKRVTGKYTAINSPYNTYRLSGLPPGPISIPSPQVMDKVLNLEKHSYLYFCAKEDFSGYHSFATSYEEHMQNAKRYQNALDALKIK
ncbi:endolytic transglycosylase MltG [Aquirufa rosea]|uniref:Endolytic murein transglycosylase n=1 Tax=Aquirufa rosea TaxID=2509241 RepID=A0A4Q1C1W1_9BACT|nr:endolytic transglycosylase MltG [Aquirufa rosea]RXK52166.1 endolytic transglycosylase MltG [Aquirufa rosea]